MAHTQLFTTSSASKHITSSQPPQPKHRTRHRSHSDPFSDPVYPSKPVPRLPPEPPSKYPQYNRLAPSTTKPSPHRDNTIQEAVRDTVQVRGLDQSSRARMGRSQTAQNTTPTRPTYTGRRSLSQDSVLHTANALDKAKGKARGKKGSMHADVIDRLDFTGVGPMFHHDGPFDACAPSRNRHRTKAPMLAWSSAGAEVALSNESPYPAPDAYKAAFSTTYQAPKKNVDAIAEAWGIHEPEPYEEFFAAGGTARRDGDTPSNSIYAGREGHGSRNGTPQHSLGKRSKDGRDLREVYREYLDDDVKQMQARDRERAGEREGRRGRRTGIPPPQPILVPEAQNTDYDSGPGSPSALPGAPKRTKSLMQRIRKMRDSPNVPMGHDEGIEPQSPAAETHRSSRPTHRPQNSFLGRFANGTHVAGRPHTSPPADEAYVYVDDPRRDKRLPATPYAPATTRTPSGEDRYGYFEGAPSSPGSGGLGRKTSLLKKVKDVVRGPK
ncbi:Pal1 cell morphology protein-domain-containing protein [Suillus paluster]|uniref:Pal1 cell morphology protein-domain-containing protein n=1 Tax=Suillus paluster TaxID=48578 RepID=UPI001B8795F0|nr:Pal1 cell morphology protein-domain-containing protein [Suillus paluster]KAG1749927.1 Pal1 cell morphology protein-domain-containing protein [Suillus paluster]